MQERFFHWSEQFEEMLDYLDEAPLTLDVYYCPQLFSQPKRKKEYVATTPNAWSDLDTCRPDQLLDTPSVVVESSPGRYQGVWCFEHPQEPDVGQDVSRRIAYAHKEYGADTSGWDLTQLLRVPYTANQKYQPPATVRIVDTAGGRFRVADFDRYPKVEGFEHLEIPFPEELPEEDAEELLKKYRWQLHKTTFELFETVPEEKKWSHRLWSLMMLLFEGEMTREEVFVVANASACNKFERDGRSNRYLWQDVCRAFFRHEYNRQQAAKRIVVEIDGPLLTDDEYQLADAQDTWIERYIKWAGGLGDAAKQYHQAGGFVALSAVLSGAVRLPTSFGTLIPNLWFMILADTTLTRKTTAMDVAMDMLDEMDDELLLATDGSLEGLLSALSTRPKRPSIFLRDEFSGLLEQMNKRDYMAGMPEMLTKLYDGKVQKRLLRKETITVKDPVLIIFAGGIRSKTQEILSTEQIASGFLPRFIFITAESDVSKVQPLGPPTDRDWGARSSIQNELREIAEYYDEQVQNTINGKVIKSLAKRMWRAELTKNAWGRYNQLEALMMKMGVATNKPEVYTPVYDRLGKSILKAATLIAASRQRDDRVVVTETDMIQAIKYGDGWLHYAKEIIVNVGQTGDEKKLQTIYKAIMRSAGISRSILMQTYHLNARDTTAILETLEQRGLINRTKAGRAEMIYPNKEAIGAGA